MPLKNYKLLVGKAKGIKLDDDSSPHIEVLIQSQNQYYRIAINVRSKIQPHDLFYLKKDNLNSKLTKKLEDIDEGVINIRNDRPDLAIDYQKDNEFEKSDMNVVPFKAAGPNNDLKEFILPLLEEAILNERITIYAFGEMWGPEHTKKDTYFRFEPSQGIHDIHMNQGSSGSFANTNGSDQDGALFIRDAQNKWTVFYLAFQSQTWKGKEQTMDSSISIIAALVNAVNPEEGRESVTLFNQSDSEVNLSGWKIKDKAGREDVINNVIMGPGEAVRMVLSGNKARLGNSGGKITLLNKDDSVVTSVSYSKSKKPEGWSHLF